MGQRKNLSPRRESGYHVVRLLKALSTVQGKTEKVQVIGVRVSEGK